MLPNTAPRAEAFETGVNIWSLALLPLLLIVSVDFVFLLLLVDFLFLLILVERLIGVFPSLPLSMPSTEETSFWSEALVAADTRLGIVLVGPWTNFLLATLRSSWEAVAGWWKSWTMTTGSRRRIEVNISGEKSARDWGWYAAGLGVIEDVRGMGGSSWSCHELQSQPVVR